jgi:acyl dehydratase
MKALVVGERLPEIAIFADRAAVERYATASGDENPLHLSDDYARAAGLTGALVHGAYLMGATERLLRNWIPDLHVRRLEAHFVQPVPHGTALKVSGRVAQVGHGTVTVRLVVKNADDAICCIAAAHCQLLDEAT